MQGEGVSDTFSGIAPDFEYIAELSNYDQQALIRSESALAVKEDAKLLRDLQSTIRIYRSATEHCVVASENDPQWTTLDIQDSHARRAAILEAAAEAIMSKPPMMPVGFQVEDHAVRMYAKASQVTSKIAAQFQEHLPDDSALQEQGDLLARKASDFGQAAASALESAFTSFFPTIETPGARSSLGPQPLELTRVQRSGSSAFRCAVAEMQGYRVSHEDAHEMTCKEATGDFWVLDGHGGDRAALAGAPALAKEVGALVHGEGILPTDDRSIDGFIKVDADLRALQTAHPGGPCGSTVIGAICAVQDGLYSVKLLNCGDSRAVVCRGPSETQGQSTPAVRFPDKFINTDDVKFNWPVVAKTVDHKPSMPSELERIEAAGGWVSPWNPPRLDGVVAVSRSLGDFMFKEDRNRPPAEQKMSTIPDSFEVSGILPGSFMILACDGLWDVITSEAAAAFVRAALIQDVRADLGKVAAQLVATSLKKGSLDNVTVMIIQFTDGSEWKGHLDEMLGFDKWAFSSDDLPEDVHCQHVEILRKWKFPLLDRPCPECKRWFRIIGGTCPCKVVEPLQSFLDVGGTPNAAA